jgi:competence protein ComEA
MATRRILLTALGVSLLCTPALAQDKKVVPGPMPAPATTPAPVTSAKPTSASTTGTATTPITAKVNLNTASAADIDKLPKIGPAGSKSIIAARDKAKFKDWNDFVGRKVVSADAAAAIKDLVSF